MCEAVIGEDINTCPNDCTPAPIPTSTPQNNSDQQSGSGQKILPTITFNSQTVTLNSIKILWSSNIPVNASISWSTKNGQTGVIQEVGYTKPHSLLITNLSSDTAYTITIDARDLYGNKTSKSFIVQTEKNIEQISLIQNFIINKDKGGAVLIWQNPSIDFEYVRIVKSTDFFPQDPYDGEVMYEGSAQSFFDSEIEENTRYFYSIFLKDTQGFSTGVGNNFILQPKQEFFDDIGKPITIFGPIYDQASVTNLDESTINTQIHFYQNDNELTQANNTYFVENQKEIVITVDAQNGITPKSELYISYFKSNNTDDARDYVFEYDKNQKKFIVRFGISNSEPTSPFIIYVRNNDEIKGYLGYFSTEVSVNELEAHFWKDLLMNDLLHSILLMLFVIFFINFWWIFILIRRKKKLSK